MRSVVIHASRRARQANDGEEQINKKKTRRERERESLDGHVVWTRQEALPIGLAHMLSLSLFLAA